MTDPKREIRSKSEAEEPGDACSRGGVFDKPGLAWASLEFARGPYYILVIIYVFAPYFGEVIGNQILASGAFDTLDPEEARQRSSAEGFATVASVTKTAGFIAALTAPFLGAALDHGGRRKPVLAILLGVIAIAAWNLWYTMPDGSGYPTEVILALLVTAYVAFTYSEVTHNSMLGVAGRPEALPMISGLGLALGNLASAVMMLFIVLAFSLPIMIGMPFETPLFGIDVGAEEHRRIAGPMTAIGLVLFSVPFFLFARDSGTIGARWDLAFKKGAHSLWTTLKRAKQNQNVLKYLGARMLYADAMAALLTLAGVYVTLYFQWNVVEMTAYAVLASFFAFGGGLVGGWLDRSFGSKTALIIEIIMMLAVLIYQLSITPGALFFGLVENQRVWDGIVFNDRSDIAMLVSIIPLAIFATASVSSSRSLLVFLAPPARLGEFFGLFAIAGTVTVWLGPMMVEVFARTSGSLRVGMSAISLLFLLGLAALFLVKEVRGTDAETAASS